MEEVSPFTVVLLRVLGDMSSGMQQQAYDTIAEALHGVDRDTVEVSAALIELATEWGRVARDLGHASAQNVAWGRWAVTAAVERFGGGSPWTMRAELALAGVHSEYGDDLAAADLYAAISARAALQGNATIDMHARELRAVSLHHAGCCTEAIEAMRRLADEPHAVQVRPRWEYLAQVAAMLRGCDRAVEARMWHDDARRAKPGREPVDPAPVADIHPAHPVVCERFRNQVPGTSLPKRRPNDGRDLR